MVWFGTWETKRNRKCGSTVKKLTPKRERQDSGSVKNMAVAFGVGKEALHAPGVEEVTLADGWNLVAQEGPRWVIGGSRGMDRQTGVRPHGGRPG